MRNLWRTVIVMLLLTACGSSSSGNADGVNGTQPATPAPTLTPFNIDKTIAIDAVDTAEAPGAQYNNSNQETNQALNRLQNQKVTLSGLAVQGSDTRLYTRETSQTAWDDDANLNIKRHISTTRITAPAITLSFNEEGAIARVSSYVGDTLYTLNDNNHDDNLFTASDGNTGNGVSINIDTNDIFGFDAGYMAYISWSSDEDKTEFSNTLLSETSIASDGMMIAGIETSVSTLTAFDKAVDFEGKGIGIYGSLDGNNGSVLTEYKTAFGVTASVDFGARTIGFDIYDTQCIGACDGITESDALDFSLAGLSFASGAGIETGASNNISHRFTIDNNLSGTLDARFYGGAAWELGGTFALAEADNRYYYGAFGAKRDGVFTKFTLNAESIANATQATTPFIADVAYDVFGDVVAGEETIFTMKALSVYQAYNAHYTRSTSQDWGEFDYDADRIVTVGRLQKAGASLTFNEEGNIADVAVYLNGKVYQAVNVDGDANVLLHDSFTASTEDGVLLTVDRGADSFGFVADHMAYIGWASHSTISGDSVIDSEKNHGMMIAGIETEISGLVALDGVIDFEGEGIGFYGSINSQNILTEDTTAFGVIAQVDFNTRRLNISAHDTNCPDGCLNNIDPTQLDFSAEGLKFSGDDNVDSSVANYISDDIVVDATLTGTLDARFYGKNDNAAHEFGGTFAVAQLGVADKRYYYGAFGTYAIIENDLFIVEETAPPPVQEEEEIIPPKNPPNQANFRSPIYYEHPINSIDNKTKKHKQIIISLSGNRYLYSTLDEDYYGTNDLFAPNNYDESLSAHISVSRNDAFNFTPKYMAHIGWDMYQIISYNADGNIAHPDDSVRQEVQRETGNLIEGHKTFRTRILPNSNGAIRFAGAGRGLFSVNKNNVTHKDYHTAFDATADVNFSKRTVNFKIHDTVCTDSNANTTCGELDTSLLDFNSTLRYSIWGPEMSGVMRAAGIRGNVNASFYGDKVEELGGTFWASNSNHQYSGYFGSKRSWLYKDANGNYSDNGYRFHYARLRNQQKYDPKDDAIITPLTSYQDAFKTAKRVNQNRFVVAEDALMVEKTRITHYSRENVGDEWVAGEDGQQISLAHDEISAMVSSYDKDGFPDSVGVYVDDEKYYISNHLTPHQSAPNNISFSETSASIYQAGAGVSSQMIFARIGSHRVERGRNFYPGLLFRTKYMASIDWQLSKNALKDITSDGTEDAIYGIRGYAVGGFKTDDAVILAKQSSDVRFYGSGHGYYSDDAVEGGASVLTRVTMLVDFGEQQVKIANYQVKCSPNCRWQSHDGFKYEATLHYDNKTGNMISGEIQSKNGAMSGKAQLSFFGPNVEEFGGTFGMQNEDGSKTYHGKIITKRY